MRIDETNEQIRIDKPKLGEITMHTTADVNVDLQQSLHSLDVLSSEFERIANDPKHYNNSLTQYLDMMALECRRMKSAAQEHIYMFGGL